MPYNVMAIDNVDQQAIDLLAAHPEMRLTASSKLARADALACIGDAHALIIRSSTAADAELIAAAPDLRVIVRAGVGVDNVDLAAASARGIVVMNVPGGNTISTAEHTFGLMLALARHIPQGHQSLLEGRWERKAYTGVELAGKTLGIVGFGRVGQALAVRARAFDMRVIAYDPYVTPDTVSERGILLVALPDLYAQSDFISLHALANDDTRGMIDAAAIAQMKDGVRLINAARGALINDADLAAAIRGGKVAGAALDVYAPEPPEDNPLVGLAGVIHTPHLAASTSDAQVTVAVDAALKVIAALVDGQYSDVVNREVLA
jgi:D-3-phosphoglycerate dehydrogenase / 2-oxoglutarate reductase